MQTDKYLLQINRIKLQDYVQCALIAPDKYFDDEIQKDIQSKNPDFLVLSDGYLQELDEHQILLELVLTDDEISALHKVQDVYYLDKPLPITRIKKIYAQDNEIIKHIAVNLETSEKGFLPARLFDTYLKRKKVVFSQRIYTDVPEDIKANNYSELCQKFDKRMGMFCFMKNSDLYYSNILEIASNYSEHYFGTLSKYLQEKLDENKCEELSILNSQKQIDREFQKLLNSQKQIDREFIENIYEQIPEEELKKIFGEIMKPNSTRKTLPLLLEKNAINLYLIALVYYFRQKDANKKDNFKIDIHSLIPYKFAEVSLAILGIYFGYKNLRATENIELKDRFYRRIFGNRTNIKFKMDSKLDYITIETIYNYSFNNEKKGCEYNYLPYPSNAKTIKLPKDKRFNTRYEISIGTKKYFDIQYVKITKKANPRFKMGADNV